MMVLVFKVALIPAQHAQYHLSPQCTSDSKIFKMSNSIRNLLY